MLPKTDMHVHIDGSVSAEMVMDLAKKHGVDLAVVLERAKADPIKGRFLQDVPPLSARPGVDEIRALSEIQGVQPDFLKMLFLGFDFAISVMQTQEGLSKTAYALVEDSAREGVMHLTAIFAPCLHGGAGLSYEERAEAVIEGLELGESKFGVTWELALGIYRGVYTRMYPDHPRETVRLAKDLARRYPNQIAIDVVGAEFEMPLDTFEAEFESLQDTGVILRAHAGELSGHASNIKTALDWSVRRIGHGIHLRELAAGTIQRIIDEQVLLEVSPVSNLKAQCIGRGGKNILENHPIKWLLEKGARVTLCTDDRSVMATDNVSQMLDLEEALGWRFIQGTRISNLSLELARNGMQAIANTRVSLEHQGDVRYYVAGIESLLRVLSSSS